MAVEPASTLQPIAIASTTFALLSIRHVSQFDHRCLWWFAVVAIALGGCRHTPNDQRAESSGLPTTPICPPNAGWDDPTKPFRVYGDTYYVGSCGISAVLIVGADGHVLIDSGTDRFADQVARNIQSLGFDPADIRSILISHEHFDHVGGIAELQSRSGARVYARGVAAEALKNGKNDRRDPQFAQLQAFPAVDSVTIANPPFELDVGGKRITMHATPGHTPGGSSYTWRECEQDRCLSVAYVDSLTALSDDSYLYRQDPMNPNAVADFRNTLATVRDLECDLLITTHPGMSAWWDRVAAAADGSTLIDADACRALAERSERNLELRLHQESARLKR